MRCIATGVKLSHVDTTTREAAPAGDAEIDRYIEREKPFDCAGGFKAEALGITLFERIDTEDPTAIVGLPLIWLAGALRAAGYFVPYGHIFRATGPTSDCQAVSTSPSRLRSRSTRR